MTNELYDNIAQYIIDYIEDYEGTNADELHNNLFNTDYFIVGYYRAEQWLSKWGIFNSIDYIKKYEQSNFGEVSTDLGSAESVANMLAYIIGEEVLNNLEDVDLYNEGELTPELIETIKKELQNSLN